MSSSLNFIAQQITIYTGIPIFIAGIIGGCLNIIVFLSLRTFRESSCAFYLTVLSFTNIGQLITGLLTRLMITGFNIDWTQSSIFYCKIRLYIVYVTALISSSCLCLAIIDQYFATCIRPHWQQWCNIKLARRLIIICSIILLLEQIPSIVFYNQIISPTTNKTTCTTTNTNFALFNTYCSVVILWCVLPLLIMVLFGILTYRNVHQIAYRTNPLVRRELDKQLTVMVLVQTLFNFIAVVPNLIITILNLNQNLKTNLFVITQLNFATSIITILFYIYFSVSLLFFCPYNLPFFSCLESILYLYMCIREISPTINLCYF
jgi:hypothetical protein